MALGLVTESWLMRWLQFQTTEWTLTTDDGRVINLIEDDQAQDPLIRADLGDAV